jgi:hypothetical protein
MNDLARRLLDRLLVAGNKSAVGVRSRHAALTSSALRPYHQLRSIQEKEFFETSMRAARQAGAIEIVHDKDNPKDGYFQRINLLDVRALSCFLGQQPYSDRLERATDCFHERIDAFPILAEVIQKWQFLGKVRGSDPDDIQDWLDAIQVILFAEKRSGPDVEDIPLRETSVQLFHDTKRIEKLTHILDVLLSGSIEAPARTAPEVWNELGLFRTEQPVLMAGKVTIERQRVAALLDTPYTGLPASTILRILDLPKRVLTIENLTTFHSEARKRMNDQMLLIYTAGMPSPSWRAMYSRILQSVPSDVPIYHWGDVDEGGLRIAAKLAEVAKAAGRELLPWKMNPVDVPEECRRKANQQTIDRMSQYAIKAGWIELCKDIERMGIVVEQEALC